jgi:hypothetical protein
MNKYGVKNYMLQYLSMSRSMDATICLLRAILLMFFSNCCHLCFTSFGVTLSRFEAVYKKE